MIPQEIWDILKPYSLAGLVILGLGFVAWRLYVRNQQLHDKLQTVGEQSVVANIQMTNALTQMAEVNRTTISKMEEGARSTNDALSDIGDNVKQLLWRSGLKSAGE